MAVVINGTTGISAPGATIAGLASALAGVSGNDTTNMSQFASLLATNGYQKLPSGLIIQWGSSSAASTTFPVAFPTACLTVLTSPQYNSTAAVSGQYTFITAQTTANFTTAVGGILFNWIAIGH